MILYPYPVPALISVWQNGPEMTSASLSAKDTRLQAEIPAKELVSGDFQNLAKWVYSFTNVYIGTTAIVSGQQKRDYFLFGKVKAGDLMEAYSLLYRSRWVRYQKGRPAYELGPGKDEIDSFYAPKNEDQQRLLDASTAFLDLFGKMDPRYRAGVLSGQPLPYAEMSPEMQMAFTSLVRVALDKHIAALPPGPERPEIGDITDGELTIKDASKPSLGVRELWVGVNYKSSGGGGGAGFRWTDYDRTKNRFSSSRPVTLVHEAASAERFSRDEMIQKSPKLRTLVTISEKEGQLSDLLKKLSADYDLNFITNQDVLGVVQPFSCENIPLWEAMDQISKLYGDWEWELAPGDFIVMRSRENSRRRNPVTK